MNSCQKSEMHRYAVKNIGEERELNELLRIVYAEEGWYVKREKLATMLYEVPESMYVLINSSSREVIGGLTCFPKHSYDVVIGMMIIRNDLRGRGLGTYLLKSVVEERTKLGQTVSLFSANDAFYEKLGFKEHLPKTAVYHFFMTPLSELMDAYSKENPLPAKVRIVAYSEKEHFANVVAYDARANGYENKHSLSVLFKSGDAMLVAINDHPKEIMGFATATVRPTDGALYVQAVMADSDIIAFWLLRTLLQHRPGVKIIRISSINSTPFLIKFGKVTAKEGGFNRWIFGDGDIIINQTQLYALKGGDFTY